MPVGLRTKSMAVGTGGSTPASWPAPVGSTGAVIPAAASTPTIRSRRFSSKRTSGVDDSLLTLRETPCPRADLSAAERISVTVFPGVFVRGPGIEPGPDRRGDRVRATGSAMTLPNVARAPFSVAGWRAARTVLA